MAEQLFQIGIKGLIRNLEGKILLLKVPEWGQNPEHWDMPGGRMEPGESFLQTLRRELNEEIGVDYVGNAKHFGTVLSNITIPVGDMRVPPGADGLRSSFACGCRNSPR
jgi:8-oxo-dGTP pyrophosphatase MutT (NUDIX family)